MSDSTCPEAEGLLFRAAVLPVNQQRRYVDEFAESEEVRREAHRLLDLRQTDQKRATDKGADLLNQGLEPTKTGTTTLIDLKIPRDQTIIDVPGIDQLPRHQYQRQRELGRGGMGAVYEVWDPAVQRPLAMKVLHKQHAEAEAGRLPVPVARFLKEAQITGQIDHPGVAPVHEIASDENGQLFFTMQVVVGKSLKEILLLSADERENDGWTQTQLLNILLKVCETLAYAHSKGIIHRDLKPANIMVGQFGETYVMDWGLAKRITDDQTDDPPRNADIDAPDSAGFGMAALLNDDSRIDTMDLTLDGSVMGTPMYMPPEQAAGEIEELGSAGDIYALGAILYHILAGIPPYSDNGSKSAVEIVKQVCAGGPTLLEKISSKISPELIAVCEKAMARDQEARYPGMVSMGDDLRAYHEHRVVKAHRTGAVVELKKWMVRNRGVAAAMALAVSIAVAGLGAISLVISKHNRELSAKNVSLAAAKLKSDSDSKEKSTALNKLFSRDLARKSSQALELDPTTALLLACKAAGLDPNGTANTAILRALEDYRELGVFPGYDYRNLTRPVLSNDGRWLASASPDFGVTLFDVSSGQRKAIILGHSGAVHQLDFSPLGDFLVSVSRDGNTLIWDTSNGRFKRGLNFDTGKVGRMHAIFSPDNNGNKIITAGPSDGTAHLWKWRQSPGDEVPQLPERQVLPGNLKFVTSVAFSPDGKRALTGSANGTAHLLDLETNTIIQKMEGHLGEVSHVAFAPQGGSMLTLSASQLNDDDKSPKITCYVWEPDGKKRYQIADPENDLLTAIFNSDGTEIITGSQGGMIRIWDVNSRKLKTEIKSPGHKKVVSVDISKNNDLIVSTDGNLVRIWKWNAPEDCFVAAGVLKGHDEPVTSVQFDGSGERVITGSRDNTVRYWRVSEQNPLWILNPDYPNSPAGFAEFDHKGESVLIRSKDGKKVTVWNISDRSGAVLPITLPVIQALFSPEGKRIYTHDTDGNGHLYKLNSDRTWSRDPIVYEIGHDISDARISGDFLLVTSREHRIAERWILGENKFDRRIPLGKGNMIKVEDGKNMVLSVQFSTGGTRLIENCKSGMRLWDVDAEDILLDRGLEYGGAFNFAPGGQTFVTWPHTIPGGGFGLELRSLNTGKLQGEPDGHRDGIFGARITEDHNWLITSGQDGLAKLWQVPNGKLVQTFTGHRGPLAPSWISRDGRHVLTRCASSEDLTTRLWNQKGEDIPLDLDEKQVREADFSQAGEFVATVFRDNPEAAIWRTDSGKLLTSLPGKEGPIRFAKFSPDDKWVLTLSWSGAVRLWPTDVLKFALDQNPRELTINERELYSVDTPEVWSKWTSLHILDEEIKTLTLLEQAIAGISGGDPLKERIEGRYRTTVKRIVAQILKLDPEESEHERRILLASLNTLGKDDPEAHSIIGKLQATFGNITGARKTIARAQRLADPDSDLAAKIDKFYNTLSEN